MVWLVDDSRSTGNLIFVPSDVPFDLALAALESIPVLTGTNGTGLGFDFSIYTGDLVSHDHNLELDRDYVEYTEVSYHCFSVSHVLKFNLLALDDGIWSL